MTRIFLLLLLPFCMACTNNPQNAIPMNYSASDFQDTLNGKTTALFLLKNKNGMTVTLTNYGAKIVSIYVPDKNGEMADVVLGFPSLGDYRKNGASHGAVVGPFANRIARAQFSIGDQNYTLPQNNGINSIHSGPESFYRQVWDAVQNENSVEMKIRSEDGQWGFPGNKTVKVLYTLTEDNSLRIDYEADTDKPTHFNLTNHSYFNLRGEGNGDILQHRVVINAKRVTPVDSMMIPTGAIDTITGTDLDFSSPRSLGERIDNSHPQLQIARGYDFNYILDKPEGELAFAAGAYEPESGRYMEVFTTEPGLQLYTGNHLKGTETGKGGNLYTSRTGVCFETQHFPDSPNQPHFPSTLLEPGQVLKSTTIFKFSVREE